MTAVLSRALPACAALVWLVPTPGGRGIAAGVAVLAVVGWSYRLGAESRAKLVAALCAAVLATAERGVAPAVGAAMVGAAVLAAAGGWRGAACFAAGGAWYLGSGQVAPAAVLTGLAAIKAGRLRPTPWILAAAPALGLVCAVASTAVGSRTPIVPRSDRDARRAALAAVLDHHNSRVVARSICLKALERGGHGTGHGESLTALMRRRGYDALSAALRIMTAPPEDARAHVAEALLRAPDALDSLQAWGAHAAPWSVVASSLHRNHPPAHRVVWPAASDLEADSLVAEYTARLLLDLGLEAPACTLASLPQWRAFGWARYVVWKARQPWEAPDSWIPVLRRAQAVPAGAWLLVRGTPARGVWPLVRVSAGETAQLIPVRSEAWSMIARRASGAGTVELLNDLRAPGEDRNAEVVPINDFDEAWFVDPVPIDAFWHRTMRRLGAWRTSVGVGHAMPARPQGLAELPPSSCAGVARADTGWLLAGAGRIVWRALPQGEGLLVVKGQMADGRWPIMELTCQGRIARHAVDTGEWTGQPLRLSCGDSLSLRFVNDFWDPRTGQDRNLWVAGLYFDPSQARAYVAR